MYEQIKVYKLLKSTFYNEKPDVLNTMGIKIQDVRPWVMSATYAPASHEITERIKKALDAAEISIPFPQRDVHLFNHNDT